jgi:hypothetical protein
MPSIHPFSLATIPAGLFAPLIKARGEVQDQNASNRSGATTALAFAQDEAEQNLSQTQSAAVKF